VAPFQQFKILNHSYYENLLKDMKQANTAITVIISVLKWESFTPDGGSSFLRRTQVVKRLEQYLCWLLNGFSTKPISIGFVRSE